ncbi:FXYD domain-containing ion transport regulator 6-like isoform X3 [Synchiropus splendidus]|uniref:FXYD domain-containing ion transport regulator 6-like isoform X3 n=1 Tax=Synchiropus splendidus TaxID=270530 RepID=UPI00237ECE52|nr:FXYD domain-containing ion transport regulator 6-like isoform X3 [Synchiropus splendidus]XP_053699539.1 FXYD domain-containing ion transport regulator 6-like isoform X3 [Synchiropus splendidus]
MELAVLVALSSCLAPALVSAADDDSDRDFTYDYESLRIGGLVFAVTLFVLGIALVVSRKCSCPKSDKSRSKGPDLESAAARA